MYHGPERYGTYHGYIWGVDVPIRVSNQSAEFLVLPVGGNAESIADALPPATATAQPSNQAMTVNGAAVNPDRYNINGSNYFKIRDLATLLNGTAAQFEIEYANGSINILPGRAYTPVGGELGARGTANVPATLSTDKLTLNGAAVTLTAYKINGSNYFKIVDVGAAFGFGVAYDDTTRTVAVNTLLNSGDADAVMAEGVQNTQAYSPSRWASISSVQQFPYMREGIAYAYVTENTLNIHTPNRSFGIDMQYPLLGDVIADTEGNFYVVWGKDGTSNTEKTVFVSKYSPSGEPIQTIGFAGEHKNGDDANTKEPFRHANCVSVINGNTLIVNYGRGMYNGHQSNGVVGVNISDMTPYSFEPVMWDEDQVNVPYVSHSFNQSLLYSEHANDFVFANHGDAYDRGFIVEKLRKEMYTKWEGNRGTYESTYPAHNIFHFYLEANANYNMGIVNETFAQLGGLVETSAGVALVGASAKSISEAAKTEKQNLFVQVFDPTSKSISSSMFNGGVTRSGAMSFDINDNSNSPLTPVTDYGVRWLTDYTYTSAVAPQVVAADDKIVILWSTDGNAANADTFYMVLSAEGEVLTPATSLGGIPLNSHEQPVYYNGAVHWVSVSNERLRVSSIQLN
jgi:hypothetical protein